MTQLTRDQSEDRPRIYWIVTYVDGCSKDSEYPWRVRHVNDATATVHCKTAIEAVNKCNFLNDTARIKARPAKGPDNAGILAFRVVKESCKLGRALTPYETYQLACAIENGD